MCYLYTMSTYVRQSAKLKCTMGSAQSALQLSHPAAPVLLCGSPMAGIADIKPMANLAPFGLCKSLANPTVAAATAAAGGKLQEMPCVPCVTSPWVNGKPNVSVKGLPALTDGSKCVCMWLGIIKIKATGQKSVTDTAPPLFATVEPKSPATAATAATETKNAEAKAAGTPKTTQPPQTPQGGTAAQSLKKGLLSSIRTKAMTAIEKIAYTMKERVTAVTSSVAATAAAAVGSIFGLRSKRADNETVASRDATGEETGATKTPSRAVTTAKTEITAKLIRNYFSDKRTFGTFEVFRGDESIFKCYTCEDTVRGDGNPDTVLKWKVNGESAIPYGKYTCDFTYSNRFNRNMWAVENVPGFSGIRIHRGKNETWTEGCLLLGDSIAKNYTMLDNSEKTVEKFEKCMAGYGNQDFVLEITSESRTEVSKSEGSKPVETTTAPTAKSTSAGSASKASVAGVTGPQDASVGQKVEYQAIFNINNVSDADRKKVTWAVSFPGIWPVNGYKLAEQGDKLILEMKQKWHREDILVYARMNAFERKVCQRTSIDPDLKTTNANRAKVCASCTFQSEIAGGCRFKESKYGYIIGDAEYVNAANKLGVEVELMKAIAEKESRGLGFRRVGQATILFERHKMREHLVATKKYSSTKINELTEKYPGIVNTETGDYNSSSYEKLETAKTIDIDCAIKSCSWGRFQVMGENFLWGKYSSSQELELAMNACDLQQFKYFVAFLEKKNGMLDALLSKNWEKIAKCYNGKAWKTKNPTYAGDIEKYYYQFKNNPIKT